MPGRVKEATEPGSSLLSVTIPTRNERATAPVLIPRLSQVLAEVAHEVIFIDDSDDETPQLIGDLAAESGLHVSLIHREGEARRGGLSTAVVEGIRAARGRYVCVMDADLQHPLELIVPLLERAQDSGADIVVASRYVRGGSSAGLQGLSRKLISWAAKWLVKVLLYERLRPVTDPLSGFFLARRSLLQETAFYPIGFKILMEILVRCRWSKVDEVPLRFAPRAAGTSKATLSQGRDFLLHTGRLFWEYRLNGLVRRFRRSAYHEET